MKAYVVEKINDKFISGVKEVDIPIINNNEVLIKTAYSSLNFKDALSSIGNKGVTQNFPHITGIDLAGIIEESKSELFKKGDKVIVTGYDLGMNTNGGHSQFVKVQDKWIIKKPKNLSLKESMIYGTAGLTAALSINELLKNGVKKEDGDILVTGASGGVGSISIAVLSKLGFNVIAISGKEDKIPYLKSLGANEVILRNTFDKVDKRPLLKEKFAGIIDTVGGNILNEALKSIKYNGVATCCGLVSSYELHTNVFPFILRAIRLIGIDSVEAKLEKKDLMWNQISNEFKIKSLDTLTKQISLNEIKETYENILLGKISSRYIVKF